MAAMVAPFTDIFRKSFEFLKANFQPVLIGAAVFGTILALGQSIYNRTLKPFIDSLPDSFTGAVNRSPTPAEFDQAIGILKDAAPYISIYILFSVIVYTAFAIYFYGLTVEKKKDLNAIIKRIPKLFFPMIGLWIWLALRTFIWIPLLGFIFAIILAPRFVFASLFLVRDNLSITQAAQKSYVATRGYWGKIVGNLILLGLIAFAVLFVSGMIIAILGLFSESLSLVLITIVTQIVSAFSILFRVQLAQAVTAAGPRKIATKK